MKHIVYILLGCFLLLTAIVSAQPNFVRNSTITVLNASGDTLDNPWAGGFNSVQFSEIDLNLDGILDLFVFDRTGNRISTFINAGIANQTTYTHAPEYAQNFPQGLKGWVLLRDYNCDGKMDIFTSFSGGIRIYTNTSTAQLNFALYISQLTSDVQPDSINPNFLNLIINSSDIPAIDDIDNDGDLDLIVGSLPSGRFVYHKNLTIERNGDCSVFDLQLRNKCWGYISENPTQNKVVFYDTCSTNIGNPEKYAVNDKHLGGTSLFALDIDASNSKDLVLGGNNYTNLLLIANDDTSPNLTNSSITTQVSTFPATNQSTIAVNLEHFPAGYYIDIDNNGIKDLIVATNGISQSKNSTNVWLYENLNLNNNPDFEFLTNSFLQEGMIEVGEGVHPVYFDYNADGLMDIVIGNYGTLNTSTVELYNSTLWLYENIGTINNPSFQLVDSNYANISSLNIGLGSIQRTLGLAPTFGDIDGDGDQDMMLGDYIGNLHYFANNAGAGNPANFVLNQAQFNGLNFSFNASPQFIDLNRDTKLDLVIGKGNGYFSYYENTGTVNSPVFSLITDSLGYVNTKRYTEFNGNSSPFIYDNGGTYRMLSGAANGYIYEFGNIDGNLTGTFSIDSTFLGIWEGVESAISVYDIDNDGVMDLLVGNYSGGLAHYKGSMISSVELNQPIDDLKIYPNPTAKLITVDIGSNELTNSSIEIFDLLGKIIYSKPIETTKTVIDLYPFTSGIYLLKFSNNNGFNTQKIIKH